jgi:ribosomal protein L37AE/L43A
MSCFAGPDHTRTTRGRHQPDCDSEQCAGCLPCTRDHCTSCHTRHLDKAHPLMCPSCVGAIRNDLDAALRLEGQLFGQALADASRAIPGGEAMVMLGPGSDGSAGLAAGDHIHESRADPTPTLTLLAKWAEQWRAAFGHPVRGRGTRKLHQVAGYLQRQLTQAAQIQQCETVRLATELRAQVGRLEAILHEGIRHDAAGVACFDCGGKLQRRMIETGIEDEWTCARCRRRYSQPEYHLAVRAQLQAQQQAKAISEAAT